MTKRPFHKFTPKDDNIWALLYERLYPEVQRYAHPLYLDGLDKLKITPDRVPDFDEMNQLLMDTVGWELLSTDVQYTDGQTWFEHLAQRKFLITEYIRPMDSLNYTPLPDIWHDVFGHLPFMVHPSYADYLETFGKRAIEFTVEQRTEGGLGSLWWYSVEFGLMMVGDDLKAFGAGLMSSYDEMQRAMTGVVEIVPYSIEVTGKTTPSPHEMHTRLFLIESTEQLHHVLDEWCDRILAQTPVISST